MTRPVRAVLIAAPDTDFAPGATVAAATATVRTFADFLARRHGQGTIALVTPAADGVSKSAVLDAFARVRPRADGELFVVVFYGHGLPATDEHPYQSWALTREELSDHELAAQLGRLPPGADTVVISNCCYGRGFLYPGPRRLPGGGGGGDADAGLPLERLSRAFASALHAERELPMVCISAAGPSAESGLVLEAVADQLVLEVQAAAERGATYAELDAAFRAGAFAGRRFCIDARPATRIADRVLAPAPRREPAPPAFGATVPP